MLLSLKDAGKALGIPYSAVYELTNRGDIGLFVFEGGVRAARRRAG